MWMEVSRLVNTAEAELMADSGGPFIGIVRCNRGYEYMGSIARAELAAILFAEWKEVA